MEYSRHLQDFELSTPFSWVYPSYLMVIGELTYFHLSLPIWMNPDTWPENAHLN